jgi:hypothetical protein
MYKISRLADLLHKIMAVAAAYANAVPAAAERKNCFVNSYRKSETDQPTKCLTENTPI